MDRLRVLLALITRDNDYQREQASVAEATARRLGIALQVIYADNDAIAQTRRVLAAIHAPEAERPRAVVVEPVGTESSQQVGSLGRDAEAWARLPGRALRPPRRYLTITRNDR